ncbi:uncharacterized protein LOC135717591 [Ochlerotatus camptorhynchus]|uniref:uncharacterized protein LOC135717591 n=1 Tax=Ochlerotatus camptorhynchus TaxID=644619 RepID=UPI0031D80CA6
MTRECSCGKLVEVEKYKQLLESLQKEKDALLLRNAQLEAQNAKLLDSLTSKLLPTPEKPFKEDEGFLDCETLQRLSHEAGDKDYLFVKFLIMQLFPVCPADNAHDTGDGEATGDETEGETAKVPLDPVRVRWIKRRHYDRRIFLRDDSATANTCYKNAGRLMTRVIANASR